MTRHIVVVGGGVIGLTTAFYLRRAGADVTVLERGTVGSGASWGNSGWVAPSFSAPLPGPGMVATALRALARPNGSLYVSPRHLPRLAPWLWRFWRSCSPAKHHAGMRAVATLALPTQRLYDDLAAEGVRFEMRSVGVVHAFTSAERAEIARRKLLPLRDFGCEAPDATLAGEELRELEPALGKAVAAGFIVPNERIVYPSSLLEGLRDRLGEMGATIREHHGISGFVTNGSVITAVRSGSDAVEMDELVLAAGVWTRRLALQLGIDVSLEAGKGYSFTISPATMPSHVLHLFEARVAASPFRAGLRLAGTMELSGMKPDLNRRRVVAVARSAKPYLNGWKDESLREEWMGMRPMTPDGLPVVGRVKNWRNLYLATGHGMHGVMLAPATGYRLAQLIVDGSEPDELKPFSPDRFAR